MMQPKQRTMFVVRSVEESRVLVLETAGDRAQWPFSRLENEMGFALGDVSRVQPRSFLAQRYPQ
jgi:hypothetical protein